MIGKNKDAMGSRPVWGVTFRPTCFPKRLLAVPGFRISDRTGLRPFSYSFFMMKQLQNYLMVLMMALMGTVVFSSCGDDDDNVQLSESIQGIWKCVSTTPYEEIDNPFKNVDGFNIGARIKHMEDSICFIDYRGKGFDLPNGGSKDNPTKKDWNSENGDKWFLKGNNLTIMQSDLDRWIGTVSVNGNEMTFIYKYQNWNYDNQTMTWEGEETYTSKFIKQ